MPGAAILSRSLRFPNQITETGPTTTTVGAIYRVHQRVTLAASVCSHGQRWAHPQPRLRHTLGYSCCISLIARAYAPANMAPSFLSSKLLISGR